LDLFFDPDKPPRSFPFREYGNCFGYVASVEPGKRQTAVILFVSDALPRDEGVCKPTKFIDIWLKVDNWDPEDFPYPTNFGYVPENNEFDNVYQYLRPYKLNLPMINN
jgi:hypothetical protein